MSTTASLILHTGSYTWATDVKWDGYLSNVGKKLVKYYNHLSVVQPLVHGGSLMALEQTSGYPALGATDEEIEALYKEIEGHTWRTNELPGVSVYFHRDAKESWEVCKYRTYDSLQDAIVHEDGNYVYLWHEPTERWYWVNWKRNPNLQSQAHPILGVPLTLELCPA